MDPNQDHGKDLDIFIEELEERIAPGGETVLPLSNPIGDAAPNHFPFKPHKH